MHLAGPAEEIALRHHLMLVGNEIVEEFSSFHRVVCGTGWASDFEKRVMAETIASGCEVIAVFDHWTNYSDRLSLAGDTLSIDQIWVVDDYAYLKASTIFPNIPVKIQPNHYLDSLVEKVRDGLDRTDPHAVLFIMEPLRQQICGVFKCAEFKCFDYFVNCIPSVFPELSRVVVRPHPSDPEGKYSELAASYPGVPIVIENDVSLEDQIAAAGHIVGMQSYAMVVALAAAKPVYCALTNANPPCVLPHSGIRQL